MDEYNINNIQKINAINFINISDDKISSSSKKPFYKMKKIEYLNSLNNNIDNPYSNKKGYSQRNFAKIPSPKKTYNNTMESVDNSYNQKPDIIFDDFYDNQLPMSSVPLYQPHNNSVQLTNAKNRTNYSQRKSKPNNENYNIKSNYLFYLNNNNNYTSYNNSNNEYPKKEGMKGINKNPLAEKQINEIKRQNRILWKKLNFCVNDNKLKSRTILDLQQKNKNLQNELSKNNINRQINNENIINPYNDQKYKSVCDSSKGIIRKFNNNNLKADRKLEYNEQNDINKLNRSNALSKSKEYFNNETNKVNNKSQILPGSFEDVNIKKILEKKDNEIKLLYQKLQKMKKNIELMALKTSNLSKLLTKKNLDLIGYQKNEIEKEKKIEQLKSLLQQNYNNKNQKMAKNNSYRNSNDKNTHLNENIEEINKLKNEIKIKNIKINELNEENEVKNKQINELVTKLNDLEIDMKGIKSMEKQNYFDIKNYKNDILLKDEEIKNLKKTLHSREEEKNNLINNINNREKDFNTNQNLILELKQELENSKKIMEQKDLENIKLINSNEELLKEINTHKNNANKEDDILLKKMQELSNENNELLDKINNINSKYQETKKLLLAKNKEIENIKNSYEKEKKEKKILNPDAYTIITNKHYKKLVWYLLHKKPYSNDNNNNKTENDENNYDNYIWVSDLVLKNEDLKKYNKFEDDNQKNNVMKELVIDLQKKLEKKEESINKLDYQNKKLTKELLNKTANLKGNILLTKNSKENLSNSFNNKTNKTIENEIKYKNILEKLNVSNQREKHLNNQINILKEKLNEKNNLENNFPHDMKHIDPHLHDSGFLDDDSIENKNIEIQNFISGDKELNNNEKNEPNSKENNGNELQNNDENNNKIEKMDIKNILSNDDENNKSIKLSSKDDPFKESEKKVDEFLMKGAGEEDDFDEVKIITKQMNFLKDEIKEYREKKQSLSSEIKDLFSKIKCNDKNRKNIVQICQLLGFQPQLVDQIISNKKTKK